MTSWQFLRFKILNLRSTWKLRHINKHSATQHIKHFIVAAKWFVVHRGRTSFSIPTHTLDLSIGQQNLKILSMGMGGLVQLEMWGWGWGWGGQRWLLHMWQTPDSAAVTQLCASTKPPPPLSELLSRLIDSLVWAPSHYLWLLPFLITERWFMQIFFKNKTPSRAHTLSDTH